MKRYCVIHYLPILLFVSSTPDIFLIFMYLIIVGDHSASKGLEGLFLHNCDIE